MARHEQPREDLLSEATALVRRAEWVAAGSTASPAWPEPVVIGFRREGSASIYLQADRVYHFNSRRQLRRAYLGALLYKAEAGRLISLDRRRLPDGVQLLAAPLDDAAQAQLLDQARTALDWCGQAIRRGELIIARQVPDQPPLAAEMATYLDSLPNPLPVAQSPHAK